MMQYNEYQHGRKKLMWYKSNKGKFKINMAGVRYEESKF